MKDENTEQVKERDSDSSEASLIYKIKKKKPSRFRN